jgi:addiction module RelE/StbE family toxin
VELSWTLDALDDLDQARRFIAESAPRAAAKLGKRILDAVEGLLLYPNLGRAGRVRGTRELVVSGTRFVVVYRVSLDQVQVLRVLHHARKWAGR